MKPTNARAAVRHAKRNRNEVGPGTAIALLEAFALVDSELTAEGSMLARLASL
ncbi:hypothetical protein [Burkholderia sp. AW49-1]